MDVPLEHRLWRVRRRHDRIDAVLRPGGGAWVLEYFRNDRRLLSWPFDRSAEARAAADVRLRELQRAGWTVHW